MDWVRVCVCVCGFRNSIGSSCRGVENLLLIDNETLAFKSENYVFFFNIDTQTLSIAKRADGFIGAITVKCF